MFQFQCSLSLPFLACQYYTVDYCIFVSLYSGNKPVRGRTAGVQGRVSWWNELRSSSTVPFFGHSAGWSSGEAFGRRKEQYSTVRECCSMCLSNYGSRTCRHYVMAPPPTPKSYKYSSPFGLRVCVGVVVGGRDSVGLVYIGLATQESFADLRLSPRSSLAPGIRRDPLTIFTIN